jgi:hypothetical protein
VSPGVRLSVLPSFVFACMLSAAPAFAGDFFYQTACDTSATSGETTFTLTLFETRGFDICGVEFRPKATALLAAVPITGWEMPDGWSADWIEGEPGAIALTGCVRHFWYVENVRITLAGRAGNIEGLSRSEAGNPQHINTHLLFCGSDPTPAAPATWGQVKSLYR